MRFFILLSLCICSLVNAESLLVYDVNTNKVVIEQNAHQQRSIASITKLMTAMTALDYDNDLRRRLVLSNRVPSSLPVRAYTREQLLNAMLVNSNNAAAETLAEDFPGGRPAFIKMMNTKALAMGMSNTMLTDPSGLSVFNISTAYDVANMLTAAAGYQIISEASNNKKQIVIETHRKKKVRTINLTHTSGQLLTVFDNVLISKTGFTLVAGWCVTMIVEQNYARYMVVVLGSRNKNERLKTVNNIRANQLPHNLSANFG